MIKVLVDDSIENYLNMESKKYLFSEADYRIELENFIDPIITIMSKVFEKDKLIKDDKKYVLEGKLFLNNLGETSIEVYDIYDNTKLSPPYDGYTVISVKVAQIFGKADSLENIAEPSNSFMISLVNDLYRWISSYFYTIESLVGFESTASEPINKLFALIFFKDDTRRRDIIRGFDTIILNPYRRLVGESVYKYLWEAEELDYDTIEKIYLNHENMVEVKGDIKPVLVYKSKGYMPLKIYTKIKRETFDTPENRFVKNFLDELLYWLEILVDDKNLTKSNSDLRKMFEDFRNQLVFYRNHNIFQEVGDLRSIPYRSQVLYRREGYREIFGQWKEFRAYTPFIDYISKAIEYRDIPTLYEIWCYFKLAELIKEALGSVDVESEIKVSVGSGMKPLSSIKLGEYTLEYNKNYKQKSYSVGLTPDFSLSKNSMLLGIFDAKFKFDIVDEESDEKESSREKKEKLDAKRIDVYKMHTYKDALHINFAIIVYPGNINKLYSLDKGIIEGSHIDIKYILQNDFNGIGYIPMKPNLER